MPATYEPIQSTTLSSTATSITFNSIPGTYTDLRLVFIGTGNAGTAVFLRYNSDSGTNYSNTYLYGNGSSVTSGRGTNDNSLWFTDPAVVAFSTTIPQIATADIFNYAGSTNKTNLVTTSNDQNGSGMTMRVVGLWRDTAAITSITISGTTMNSGTTATLFGIKAA